MKTNLLSPLATLGLLIFCLRLPAISCSRVSVIKGEVKHDFRVRVLDPHNKPLQAIQIDIKKEINKEPYLTSVGTSLTGTDGTASFRNLASGRYALCYSHLQGGDCPEFVISDDKNAQDLVVVGWPARPIQHAKRIAGTFLLADTNEPFSGAVISVTDAWSGHVVGTTTTDSNGRFRIETPKADLYVLSVEQHFEGSRPAWPLAGNMYVEVSADAKDDELPVFPITVSSCGLTAKLDANRWLIF